MSTDVLSVLGGGLRQFIAIYTVIIFIRLILTWFPTVNWSSPPLVVLSQLTDPYLNLFRSLIPPLGGLDLSPMLAIFLLQIVGGLIP
ncbi:YggT family protein [Altericista sp. CCNU0014]|jgi:YggT family protein|uniref:YggT family protein n=1 Tax=Altericista sp. CCNU0014 TaxID=3082949 RepID=UPI003851547C